MENGFLEKIYILLHATKQSKRSSVESKSSTKSKIDLRNETSAEDKFQSVKETKLQKF